MEYIPTTTDFPLIKSEVSPRVCSAFPHQNQSNTLHTMPRQSGQPQLTNSRRGGVLALIENSNLSNVQIAQRMRCHEKTVRNIKKRAQDAEKENIDPYEAKAIGSHPRPGQPSKITIRDQRRLIRQATKNRFQRRKPWTVIASECGIQAHHTAINNAFIRAGYERYPSRHKPQLSSEIKKERYTFAKEWLPKLKGKEHMIMYTNKTSVRVEESRG